MVHVFAVDGQAGYNMRVSDLLIGLLGALISTNPVLATSNLVQRTTGLTLPVVNPKDPVEMEYKRILEEDDKAQAEVDSWIQDNQKFGEQGAGISDSTLNARIDQRLVPVVRSYEDFINHHPDHARIRLAYGSFLTDVGRDQEALVHWERARELEPTNAAAWNNLAGYYGHFGPISRCLEYFAKAIELAPRESVYYHSLGTMVFLYRKDSKEVFKLEDDQAVFRRALELYEKALQFDPSNFAIATDLAQTYYYLKPAKTGDAEKDRRAEDAFMEKATSAWNQAQKLAHDDLERQGVSVHLARVNLEHGRFDAARRHLEAVTLPKLKALHDRVERKLNLVAKGEKLENDPDDPTGVSKAVQKGGGPGSR